VTQARGAYTQVSGIGHQSQDFGIGIFQS
jgi:hypothetical protein